jgi:hypothetical protein
LYGDEYNHPKAINEENKSGKRNILRRILFIGMGSNNIPISKNLDSVGGSGIQVILWTKLPCSATIMIFVNISPYKYSTTFFEKSLV